MDTNALINTHYGNDDIYSRIIAALREAGLEPGAATIETLAPIDQFHTGGMPATKALANRITIQRGSRIFEAGCGIGGAARFLAETYDATVLGMDLSEEFIDAASPLNELLGLSGQVTCGVGDITDTGIDGEQFDVVWSQNVLMNVEDKAAALREAYRLLKPGGNMLMQAVMLDKPGVRTYPVPWAPTPDIDFLISSADFKQLATDAGFTITVWEESRGATPAPVQESKLNFSVIMRYPDFGPLLKNFVADYQNELIVPAVAVLTK